MFQQDDFQRSGPAVRHSLVSTARCLSALLAVLALVGSGRAARAASVAEVGGEIHFVSQAGGGSSPDIRGGEIGYELIVDPDTGAKTVGDARHAPVEIDLAMDAGLPAIAGWLDDFLAGEAPVRDFVVQDDGTARRHRGGYVAAIRFSRDAEFPDSGLSLGLTLGFDHQEAIAPDPSLEVASAEDDEAGPAKGWTPAAFEFELGSLPCSSVSKIDAFEIEQVVVGAVEVPNLRVTFSAADAEAWLDWFEDFAVAGNASDADELAGRLTFFSPDQKETLAIDLRQVGILSIAPAVGDDGAPSPDELVAEIYVEEMAVAIEKLTLAHEGFESR